MAWGGRHSDEENENENDIHYRTNLISTFVICLVLLVIIAIPGGDAFGCVSSTTLARGSDW